MDWQTIVFEKWGNSKRLYCAGKKIILLLMHISIIPKYNILTLAIQKISVEMRYNEK